MREELRFNITNYLKVDNKKQNVIKIGVIVLSIILIYISFTISIYKVDIVNAQTTCDNKICILSYFVRNSSYEKYEFVKIKNKKYKIKNIVLEEASINENNDIIQEVSIELKDYKGINNEIVKINLLKNKEKIINKIVKIIVER